MISYLTGNWNLYRLSDGSIKILKVSKAKDYMGAFGSDGYLYDFAKASMFSSLVRIMRVFLL